MVVHVLEYNCYYEQNIPIYAVIQFYIVNNMTRQCIFSIRNSSESRKEFSAVDHCFRNDCFSQNAIHNNKSDFRSMLLDIKFERKDQLDSGLLFTRVV